MFRRAVVTVTLLGLGACDSTGPDPFSGTYNLESINASALPFEYMGIQIVSGSITLRLDGTYFGHAIYRDSTTGEMTSGSSAGTFSMDGSTILMTWTSGVRANAFYDGKSITFDTGGLVGVYRR